jgi:branched-subunit amino acid transport protein
MGRKGWAHRHLPKRLIDWHSFIPVVLLGALPAPILFIDTVSRSLDLGKPELLLAIHTLLSVWKMRSLGGMVIVGMLLS